MTTETEDFYSISQPKTYIFATKNAGKIFFLSFIIIFIIALAFQENLDYIKRLINVFIVCGILGLIFVFFLKYFAYKIDINFDKKIISFYMCRSSKKIYSFDSIKKISIGKYIKFHCEKEKIFYNIGNEKNSNSILKRLESEINDSKLHKI